MQRDADEIFRVKDLSMLKSPLPSHLRSNNANSHASSPRTSIGGGGGGSPGNNSTSIPIARPTPKPMAPPPARPKPSPLMAMMVEKKASTSTISTPIVTTVKTPVVVPVSDLIIQSPLSKKASTEAGEDLSAMMATLASPEKGNVESTETFDSQIEKAISETEEKPTEDRKQEEVEEEVEEMIVSPVQFDLKDHVADKDKKQRRTSHRKPTSTTNTTTNESTNKENIIEQPAKVALVTAEQVDEPKAEPTAVAVVEATPTAVVDKQMSSSKEYVLDNWYFQRIPNNPKFSKVDRSLCEEWIVLVGLKSDLAELWHSSIVTGIEGPRRIITGSGRIYNLSPSFDHAAMIKAGFTSKLADRFAKGFPAKWKEFLIEELSPSLVGDSVNVNSKKAVNVKTPSSIKTIKKKTSATPKTPRTPRTPRSVKSPSATRTIVEVPKVIGETRSGRKVVTPIPFWDSQAAATFSKPSPTVRVKRRWGQL